MCWRAWTTPRSACFISRRGPRVRGSSGGRARPTAAAGRLQRNIEAPCADASPLAAHACATGVGDPRGGHVRCYRGAALRPGCGHLARTAHPPTARCPPQRRITRLTRLLNRRTPQCLGACAGVSSPTRTTCFRSPCSRASWVRALWGACEVVCQTHITPSGCRHFLTRCCRARARVPGRIYFQDNPLKYYASSYGGDVHAPWWGVVQNGARRGRNSRVVRARLLTRRRPPARAPRARRRQA